MGISFVIAKRSLPPWRRRAIKLFLSSSFRFLHFLLVFLTQYLPGPKWLLWPIEKSWSTGLVDALHPLFFLMRAYIPEERRPSNDHTHIPKKVKNFCQLFDMYMSLHFNFQQVVYQEQEVLKDVDMGKLGVSHCNWKFYEVLDLWPQSGFLLVSA